MAALFAVCFPGHSYPITAEHWARVDETHWVLDVCTMVRPQYWEVKEVTLFLCAPNTLAPDLALGLYVKCGDSQWLYRGCVHAGHPSEAMPLQVGVSIEPLAELAAKEGSRLGDRMLFGRRVGLDLYRFLESFATQATGDAILIPTSALDRWLERFERRYRLDPDYLTRDADKV